MKEKGLKYFDNWRTNEIAVVKDKKMVLLARESILVRPKLSSHLYGEFIVSRCLISVSN